MIVCTKITVKNQPGNICKACGYNSPLITPYTNRVKPVHDTWFNSHQQKDTLYKQINNLYFLQNSPALVACFMLSNKLEML